MSFHLLTLKYIHLDHKLLFRNKNYNFQQNAPKPFLKQYFLIDLLLLIFILLLFLFL